MFGHGDLLSAFGLVDLLESSGYDGPRHGVGTPGGLTVEPDPSIDSRAIRAAYRDAAS